MLQSRIIAFKRSACTSHSLLPTDTYLVPYSSCERHCSFPFCKLVPVDVAVDDIVDVAVVVAFRCLQPSNTPTWNIFITRVSAAAVSLHLVNGVPPVESLSDPVSEHCIEPGPLLSTSSMAALRPSVACRQVDSVDVDSIAKSV